MDRRLSGSKSANHDAQTHAGGFLLPSRQTALATCLDCLHEGLVVVTGEAGAGKTWLSRQLAAQTQFSWICVDIFPGMTAQDLFAAICESLSVTEKSSRLDLREILAERQADGRTVGIAIDECHLASTELLEEIRLLSNRLGTPGGFAAIVVMGQTGLSLRVDSNSLRALESRVACRVHLRSLDLEEAETLLSQTTPHGAWTREQFEVLHRDAAGNPRRLLRMVRHLHRPTPAIAASPVIESKPAESTAPEPIVLGPSKPPLRIEEGLIEVGYDSVLDFEEISAVGPRPPSPSEGSDEKQILDHYAALQAWDEWARNQGRDPLETTLPAETDDMESEEETEPEGFSISQSWTDSGQTFAPYSQLFSRLRPATKNEESAEKP